MSERPPGKLEWPPRKRDLERFYLDEKLSAMKIANLYGLQYKNPKVAESTVLHYLKRNGIKRRDSVELSTKFSERTVDDWVKRYEAGESLKEIAGGSLSPATILFRLRKRGLKLRDKVEAQIAAVTRYPRRQFSGGRQMEAYLIGFSRGDLNASRHGRAVRLKTATTHPLMVEHLKNLFEPFGHVLVSPRLSKLAGYEWSVQVDLDESFSFLLRHGRDLPRWIFRAKYLIHFVAGFFDAEGSIWLNQTTTFSFEVSLTNSDLGLLRTLANSLRRRGFRFYLGQKAGTSVWYLHLWQKKEVNEFLKSLPLKHPEKISKARIALRDLTSTKEAYPALVDDWNGLLQRIKADRDDYVDQAMRLIQAKDGH